MSCEGVLAKVGTFKPCALLFLSSSCRFRGARTSLQERLRLGNNHEHELPVTGASRSYQVVSTLSLYACLSHSFLVCHDVTMPAHDRLGFGRPTRQTWRLASTTWEYSEKRQEYKPLLCQQGLLSVVLLDRSPTHGTKPQDFSCHKATVRA